MTPFERAWAFLQRSDVEGGTKISDDLDDPGGLTRWGISSKAYPGEDIRHMTEARARILFRRDYWDPCRCDELPPPIALALADGAFNQGQVTAVKTLQASLGVKMDGVIGPVTLAALKAPDALNEFLSHRLLQYAHDNPKYMRGYFLRVLHLKDEATRP